jgi:poly(3-hydroxybutyrate) depolymerase
MVTTSSVSEATFGNGRLSARVGAGLKPGAAAAGSAGQLRQLAATGAGGQNALLYVPSTVRPGSPAPFILTLHGAGGDAQNGVNHLISHADAFGCILLSPKSRSSTWDMLRGGYGPGLHAMVACELHSSGVGCMALPQRCIQSG